MKCWAIGLSLAILSVAVTAQGASSRTVDSSTPRVTTLVLQPARIDTGRPYFLLPPATELRAGDAAVLYAKAIDALPKNLAANETRDWISALSSGQMPLDKAQALAQQAQASLQLATQGAVFKKCSPVGLQSDSSGSAPIRHLGTLLCVKAHSEIMLKHYDDAISSIRTGLALSRHIGESSNMTQGLLGVAMSEMTLQRLAELAQAPGAPNLEPALKALPQPLIDIEGMISRESQGSNDQGEQRTRQILERLRGTVAGLQCIEALRHYAATHDKKLPAKLSDISDVQLPNDPATGKPFTYRLEGSKAILEVSPPKGGTPRDGTRYEITIAP